MNKQIFRVAVLLCIGIFLSGCISDKSSLGSITGKPQFDIEISPSKHQPVPVHYDHLMNVTISYEGNDKIEIRSYNVNGFDDFQEETEERYIYPSNIYGVYLLTYNEDDKVWFEPSSSIFFASEYDEAPEIPISGAEIGKGEQILFTLDFYPPNLQYSEYRLPKTVEGPIKYKLVVANDERLGNKHVRLEKQFETLWDETTAQFSLVTQ